MDILPRVKNGEFAYYPHRRLMGTTAARILATVAEDYTYLTSADADAAMRMAYNFVATKKLNCTRIALFNNVLTPADHVLIAALDRRGAITIEHRPGRAPVMTVLPVDPPITDPADHVAAPSAGARPSLIVRERGSHTRLHKREAGMKQMADRVATLNAWSQDFRVRYRPTWSKTPVPVMHDALHYTRMFLGDNLLYGRLTALFQSLSKVDRATITINGAPAVEVDYTAMHPTLLYARCRLPRPVDLYGFCPHLPREHRKLALLISLNAQDRASAETALASRIYSTPKATADLLDGARAYHAPIAPWFWSDMGVHLMRTESDIAISVLNEARMQNIPVLCMHDGFICRRADEGIVRIIMENKFHQHAGTACATSCKGL